MKDKFLLFISFILLSSCASIKSKHNSNSVSNTSWTYVDNDWSYEIQFLENGKLKTTHPNDITKKNDTWEQNGTTVYLYFSNKYSTYEGQMHDLDTISGTAKNSTTSWDFKMYRKK